MAKYTINYSCGHGSIVKELFGKGSERDRKIAWMEENMVCPECFKAQKKAEDAAAEKIAKICLVPAAEPIISIEVKGQIEANKEKLYALGYSWSDSNSDGLMGYFSLHAPKRALAVISRVESVEQSSQWIKDRGAELENLGYSIQQSFSALDYAYIAKLLGDKQVESDKKAQAVAKLAEIKKNDPPSAISSLRRRIAELEKSSGSKWNGKIYGKKGGWNFYVNNEKYTATDAEVAEREKANEAIRSWNEKYKTEIEAAK